MATGRADEAHVGYAGKLDDLPDGSFDVVLYRLVLHHLAFQGPLAPMLLGGRAAARARRRAGGDRARAVAPGRARPRARQPSRVRARGARHAATTSRCLRGGWSAEARAAGLVPELHAVTYTWRRLPPGVQRSLQPLDALGSRPRAAVFGHTLMLIARDRDSRFRLDRAKGADTLAAVSSIAPAPKRAASRPGRRQRLRPLPLARNNHQRGVRMRPRRTVRAGRLPDHRRHRSRSEHLGRDRASLLVVAALAAGGHCVRCPGTRLGRGHAAAVRGTGGAHVRLDRLVGAARQLLDRGQPDARHTWPRSARRSRWRGCVPERWPALLGAVATAATVICGYALLIKVFPATLDADDLVGRLKAPFGYWNAHRAAGRARAAAVHLGRRAPVPRADPAGAERPGALDPARGAGAFVLARRADRRDRRVRRAGLRSTPMRLRARPGARSWRRGRRGADAVGAGSSRAHPRQRRARRAHRTPATCSGSSCLSVVVLLTVVGFAATVALDRVVLPATTRRRIGRRPGGRAGARPDRRVRGHGEPRRAG